VQGLIRGFVTGVIWGGVVAATGLAVVSQVAPLPKPGAVAEGGASPASAPLPDAPDAVEPEAVEPIEETAPAPVVETPEAAAPEAVPDAVTSEEEGADVAPPEALQPEILQKGPAPAAEEGDPAPDVTEPEQEPVSAPVAESDVPAIEPEVDATSDADPVAEDLTTPEETIVEQALAQPGLVDDTAPEAPALPAAPEAGVTVPEALAEAAPGMSGAETPALPDDEAAPARTENPPAPEEPLLQPAPEGDAPPVPALIVPDAPLPTVPETVPEVSDAPEDLALAVPGVRIDRLPRIGDDAAPAEDGMSTEEAATPVLPEAVLGTTPLELFRREFDNPEAKPLFGIILIDEGIPAEEKVRLASLPFAISFAVDPLAADSADAAVIYRSAGQEVVMLASGIPQGATAGDLEQTFQALDMAMPEAVAVLDPIDGGFQDSLDLARQAVPIVAEQGRGIVTYDRGLNSADQVARREGVPRATIFRVLDAEGESIPKMRNYLDRAAFKAAQEGRVLVIGSARAETVAAILEWTVEGRAASVALAPLSAILETTPSP
jgi:hypothetical protein